MKSANVHAILGEVYRLLGGYIAADFNEASEYKGITPHLREALRALAREADRSPSNASRLQMNKTPSAVELRRA
jgi:hypothetical protein